MRRRAVAARQKTLAVNLRETMKNRNKGEKMRTRMKTEGRGDGRQAAVVARAARRGPEKCEMRKRSLAVMTTATTMSQRIRPGAAGRRAATVRMKEGTEEAAGVAAPLLQAATAAATIQRLGLRVGVEVTEAQIPVTPATVNKTSEPVTCLIYILSSKHWRSYTVIEYNIGLMWG